MQFDSRTEIIMATWNVIAEKGLEGVRIRSIAADAGVSQGRIQHHFKTRDGLIVESCQALMDMAGREYGSSVPTLHQKLLSTVAHAIAPSELTSSIAVTWQTYAMASAFREDIAALFRDYKQRQEREAAEILQDLGVARADARTVARILIALADGLAPRVLTGDITAEEAYGLLRASFPPEAEQSPSLSHSTPTGPHPQ